MKNPNSNRAIKLLLASTAISPFLLFTPAMAQNAPSAATEETVIVTARRREEALKDVPLAVSSFSSAKLEATGAPDITVLQQVTPNATIQVARGTNSTLIAFIRGVGQQDPLWGFEPGVGLYIDDVYVSRPQGAVLDIFDIQRIEVLRGPQGSLYGRNTIGGAVKYVTRRLGAEATGRARVSVGSYDQLDFVASGSVPLSDVLRVGGAIADYNRDGFGRNITTNAGHYDKDVQAFRLSAELAPRENLFFRLAYDKVTDDSNAKHGHREAAGLGLTTGAVVLPNVYDTDAGIGSTNHVENQGLSLSGELNVNDFLTIKYIGAHREGKSNTLIDFDTNQAVGLDVPARYDDEQNSHEFQALFTAEKWSGVVGLYTLDARASGAFDTIVGLLNLTIATSGTVDTKSTAIYGDFSFELTDNLSLSLGGRLTKDRRGGTVYRQNFTGLRSPLFGNPAAVPGLLRSNYSNTREFNEFTPRASLSYKINPDITAYVAYSEGFKSGGFDMRGDAVLTPLTVNGYNPEFVKSYEAGLKGSLFNGHANFAAAIFRADYEGQQITRQEPTVFGSIASFVDNAGSSEIQGFELEGGVNFNREFGATFGLGYTDAHFNSFITKNAAGVVTDLSSTAVFQNTPKWNGNFALNYNHAMGDMGSVAATLSASYRSKFSMFEFVNPSIDQNSNITLVDAGVSWTTSEGHLKVSLSGRNLTDERYKIGGYLFAGATFGNVVNSFYGPPRTFTGSLQVKF
ncbi:MAG: TonB-dependent receptor [Hyphomonadaceae bacterium]|nr:MAG: TonB-dependent receptor [Hyphomonadaceae bacterium]